MNQLLLKPGKLRLAQLREVYFSGVQLTLDQLSWASVEQAQFLVQDKVDSGEIVYGVNTGFGRLAQKHIEPELLSELQHNLILSHATGVGNYIDEATTCLLYTSPSPRDGLLSRMPSSA